MVPAAAGAAAGAYAGYHLGLAGDEAGAVLTAAAAATAGATFAMLLRSNGALSRACAFTGGAYGVLGGVAGALLAGQLARLLYGLGPRDRPIWPFFRPYQCAMIARMRRIKVTDPHAHDLVEAILARDAGMPVRVLEELLTRGDAGLGMLILAVRQSLDRYRCPGYAHWSAVGLGMLGDADAAPELTLLMRWAWRAPAIDLGFSAAEGIARLGAPAEEALLRHAELTPRPERYWFHYAAACLATQRAGDWLRNELERNAALADSAALALAVLGRTDVLPALDRALRRAKAWQLPAMAEAVRSLHSGESPVGSHTRDWRLRYRYQPRFGRFPSALPCLLACLRSHVSGRRAAAEQGRGVPRSVERILAESDDASPRKEPRCEVCRRGRSHYRTAAVFCDDCAPAAARRRAECLLAVESRSNDIFDVLNVLDNQIMNHDVRRLPETEQYRRWLTAQSACHWLVEQGIETAAGGAAMLLAVADGEGRAAPAAGGSGAGRAHAGSHAGVNSGAASAEEPAET